MFFIGDLDVGIECILSKFPDNTKAGVTVNSREDTGALHRGLDRLESWAITTCMEFNNRGCWVLARDGVMLAIRTHWATRGGEQPCGNNSRALSEGKEGD